MIQVDALAVIKEKRLILGPLTLALAPNRVHALIGPNGAGKSTLLRAFAGLETRATGRIVIEGRDLATLSLRERARLIAWVPAATEAPFAYTAHEAVVFGRFVFHEGIPRADDLRAADAALDELGIASLAGRLLPSLSSGERQKVLLARALASEASILLLDEPSASLDIAASLHLLTVLRQRAARGTTVIAALHDIGLALRFADEAVCLRDGHLMAAGAVAQALSPEALYTVFHVGMKMARTDAGETVPFFMPYTGDSP